MLEALDDLRPNEVYVNSTPERLRATRSGES